MGIAAAQLIAIVTAETAGAEANLARVSTAFDRAGGAAATSMGPVAKFGVGVAAVGVGLAAFAVDKAAKYQAAMANVAAYTNLTTREVDKAKGALLTMAEQTGQAPEKLAKGLLIAASAGLGLSKALEVTRYSAQMASAGLGSAESVTLALGSAMTAYQKSGMTAKQAADYFTAAVRESHVPVDALASKIGLVAGNAASLGIKFPEVIANIAAMTRVSGNAANASTSFNSVILSLTRMVNPSKQVKTALSELGLTGTQVALELKNKGLYQTLQDLADRNTIYAHSHDGLNSAMVKLFPNVRSLRDAFGTAGAQGEAYKASLERVMHASDGAGAAQEAWAKITPTFSQEMRSVRAEVDVLAIQLGTALIPALETGGHAFMAVVGFFEAHHTTFVIAAAVIGGILAGAVVAATVALGSMAVALIAATWPFLAVGAAAGLLVVGIKAAWDHFETFRDVVRTVMADVLAASQAVWGALTGIWRAFVDGPVKYVQDQIAVFSTFWSSHLAEIRDVARVAWDAIKVLFQAAMVYIHAVVVPALDVIAGVFKATFDVIKGVISTIFGAIKTIISTDIHVVLDTIAVVLDLITGHWSKAWNDLKKLAGDALHGVVTLISGIAAGFGSLLLQAGKDLISGLINGVKSMGSAVGDAIKGIANGAVSAAKSFLGIRSPSTLMHDQIGVPMGQGMASGLDASAADVAAAAARLGAAAVASIQSSTDTATSTAHGTAHRRSTGTSHRVAHHAAAHHAAKPIRDVYGTYTSQDAKYAAEVARHNETIAKSHEAAADRIEKAHAKAMAAAAKAHERAQKAMEAAQDKAEVAALASSKKVATRLIEDANEAAKAQETALLSQQKTLETATSSMEKDLAGLKKEAETFSDSLQKGLTSGMGDVVGLFKDLTKDTTDAQKALDAANLSVTKATAAYSDMAAQQAHAKTTTLAQQQALEDASTAVKDATAKATAAQDAYNKATRDAANPITLLTTTLQDQLAKTQKFGADLSALTAQGASKDLVAQLAKAGADSGDALAQALLASGPGAVKNIDALMGQIQDAGKTAADAITAQYYQAGIDSMTAQIAGMQAKEAALQAEVDRVRAIMASLTAAKEAVTAATNTAGVTAALSNAGIAPVAAAAAASGAAPTESAWTPAQRAYADSHGIGGGVSGTTIQVHIDGESIAKAVDTRTKQVLTTVAHKAANGRR